MENISILNSTSTSEDKLEVIPLGSGMEVGRSAVIVKFRGKTVLVKKLKKN
jgi:predicted metal-dependent RNase